VGDKQKETIVGGMTVYMLPLGLMSYGSAQ
jgi:hypothetical protein